MELYLDKGKLISEKKWKSAITQLRKKTQAHQKQRSFYINLVKGKLFEAVAQRVPPKKLKYGIMFSGGVDSTVIAVVCKKFNPNFTCYAVGVKSSKDLAAAKRAAKAHKLILKVKEYSLEEVEKIIKTVVGTLKKPDAVSVGVGSVVFACMELAKKDKVNLLFAGLGSEEIFAGYQRHELAKDINEECWNGLQKMWSRDLIRDYQIARHEKIGVATPFLDEEMIIAAMQVPGKYKIDKKKGVKKLVLREAALKLGVKKEFAYRKKIAAQYGSGFHKALEKIARQSGFKYVKDYLAYLKSK